MSQLGISVEVVTEMEQKIKAQHKSGVISENTKSSPALGNIYCTEGFLTKSVQPRPSVVYILYYMYSLRLHVP